MFSYHKICKECTLNGECLLQDNESVDECEDVINYEMELNPPVTKVEEI